jgi:cytochrome c
LIIVAVILLCGVVTMAQAPTYNLGRTLSEHELEAIDTTVGPDGQGLPPGKGTAKEGATAYLGRNCATCHGPTGVEGPGPRLVGDRSGVKRSPFAPMIWNTINQMMPLDRQQQYYKFSVKSGDSGPKGCCLAPGEVYSLTAFLLYSNGIIQEGAVMDAKTLPQVQMPNRDEYAAPPYINSEWKPGLRKPLAK